VGSERWGKYSGSTFIRMPFVSVLDMGAFRNMTYLF